MDWEFIDNYHARSNVPGGWIVKAFECIFEDGDVSGNHRIAICFVPDPDHDWIIEK